MRNIKISIAMAVCNGEKFLKDQLDSILVQIEEQDEIIISYDTSEDGTFDLIQEYAEKNSAIKIIINKDHSKGLVSNFENALRHCSGDIIFYSDQDDIWLPSKLQKVSEKFLNPQVTVVVHDSILIDERGNEIAPSTFAIRGGNTSLIRNLIRLSYIGCAMAFRADMLPVVLPLATWKRSHDWWTGSICSCYGKMEIIRQPLILHRIHGNNATPKKRPSLFYQIAVRIKIVSQLIIRKTKYKKLS